MSSVVTTALSLVSVFFPGQRPPRASHIAASSREHFNHGQSDLEARGWLPVERTIEQGFPNQVALHLVKQKLEPPACTTTIFGEKDAGFGRSGEVLAGSNYSWFDFGFYVGGQKGPTVSVATSFYF